MKSYSFIFTLGLLVLSLFSCDNNEEDKVTKPWNPGPLTEYSITPINGGATISYTIPNDPDIMYVMAEYERNGRSFTEKSSVHKNSLTIDGFHKQNSVNATLYKVNKFEQRSEPLTVEFEPLESLISIAQNSLEMITGFGGIIASWDNPRATELGVRLMVEDEEEGNQLVTKDMYFSAVEDDLHPFRGFEAVETKFALAFEDKWGNISDTITFITTPFFETMVPKPYADFRSSVPYDNTSDYATTRPLSVLWDNIVNTSSHGWLTKSGNSGLSITFDMKQVAKLSRIVIHGYTVNAPYSQANITKFELWGTDKFDYSKITDKPYWLDEWSVRLGALHGVDVTTQLPERTFKDDWVFLGEHEILRHTDSEAILDQARNGTEYTMPLDAAPVRYVRLFVREITGNPPSPSTNYFSMGEMTFYGDNTVPQE